MRAIIPEPSKVLRQELPVAGNKLRHDVHAKVNVRRIGLLVACLLLFGCSNEQGGANSFFDEKLACPAPAVAEFQAWGKSGTQQICKIKHGPFVAWEGGYIHIRGQYEHGREVGVWFWYDKHGNEVKKLNYSSVDVQPQSSGRP